MGANEFNSESTPQQSDGDNRDADGGIEESESLLERVREEQRRFEARINSLADAVKEYAQVISDIRELRVQRAKERSITELKQNWNQLLNHTQNLTTVIQELKNSPPPEPITIEKEVYRSEPISKYGMMGLFTCNIYFVDFLWIQSIYSGKNLG